METTQMKKQKTVFWCSFASTSDIRRSVYGISKFLPKIAQQKKPRMWKIPLGADKPSIGLPTGYTRESKFIRHDPSLVRPELSEETFKAKKTESQQIIML